MKIAFFDMKEYDKESFLPYENDQLQFIFYDTKLNTKTVTLTKGADAVCVFVNDEINEEVINKLVEYNVKLIALRCAGYNNVDLTATNGKIAVVRVPAYSPYAVAEHTMALLLCFIRKIHKAYLRTKDFNFSLNDLIGFDLYGKTIGIIGTGRIGKVFINICLGFGMKILAYDKTPSKIDFVQYTTLDELITNSDIISLHSPLTSETFHLINQEKINKMKDGVIILNTSRGALIDSEALLEGIKTKKIGGACLDVYEEEADFFFEDLSNQIITDDVLARLITMPNVLVTSHQAFLTKEALEEIAETTISNITSYLVNKELCNEVVYQYFNKNKENKLDYSL